MKRLVIAAAVGFFAIAVPFAAQPFGTVYILGQHGEHERITRAALTPFALGPRTLDEIAGKRGSFGAVGAPDNPLRGLMSNPGAHCDGGDYLPVLGYPQTSVRARAVLTACRDLIRRSLAGAVTQAGRLVNEQGVIDESQVPTAVRCGFDGRPGRAKCEVLERLGLAFHAAQDFYSHSNWTDAVTGEVGPENPQGLGHTGRAPWLDPRLDVALPEDLISGCYEGFPESAHCAYANGRLRVRHAVLNKDTGPIDITDPANPRIGAGTTRRGAYGGNFERAVRAAIDDTRDKWAFFETQVVARYGPVRGARIVCVMRADNPSRCR